MDLFFWFHLILEGGCCEIEKVSVSQPSSAGAYHAPPHVVQPPLLYSPFGESFLLAAQSPKGNFMDFPKGKKLDPLIVPPPPIVPPPSYCPQKGRYNARGGGGMVKASLVWQALKRGIFHFFDNFFSVKWVGQ